MIPVVRLSILTAAFVSLAGASFLILRRAIENQMGDVCSVLLAGTAVLLITVLMAKG